MRFKDINIKYKFLLPVLSSTLILFIVIIYYSNMISTNALAQSFKSDLMLELHTISASLKSDIDSRKTKVRSDLKVARSLFEYQEFKIDNSKAVVTATNQVSKTSKEIELDNWFLNGNDLLNNHSFVDYLQETMGGTATIFQKIDDGFLRISTNVRRNDKTRAVGTYIPNSSPVIKKILNGESFFGRAFVVNDWYTTAYSPIIIDEEIVGILYVGIKEKDLSSLLSFFKDVEKTEITYPVIFTEEGEVIYKDKLSLLNKENSNPIKLVGDEKTGITEIIIDDKPYFFNWEKIEEIGIYLGSISVQDNLTKMSDKLTNWGIILAFISITLITIIIFFISNMIAKSVSQLKGFIEDIAEGNFNAQYNNDSKDELGVMATSIENIRVSLLEVDNQVLSFREGVVKGDINYTADTSIYTRSDQGLIKSVLSNINGLSSNLERYIDELPVLFVSMDSSRVVKYSNRFATEKLGIQVGSNLNNVITFDDKDGFEKAISSDLKNCKNSLTTKNGTKFHVNLSSNKLHDRYDEVVGYTIIMSDETAIKARENEAVVARDEALTLKSQSEETLRYQKVEVEKLQENLISLSEGDLTKEYRPEYFDNSEVYNLFTSISDVLERTYEKLTTIIVGIMNSSEQIDSGSSQLAEASDSLSAGSTEQSSAIEELSATMVQISSQTNLNADNAKTASKIADDTKTNSDSGKDSMVELNKAIIEINDGADEIKNVMKAIDTIAFQTNLLALNAAVEAARAGVHGKGFAVVADEVRNLAQRSSEAAKETEDLINSAVNKARIGLNLAEKTVTNFDSIQNGIIKTRDIIHEIAVSSEEQARGIEQSNQGLSQVSAVTQSNASNSEETAAAATELSSQSESLKAMVQMFKVK